MAKTPDGFKACPFCGGEAEFISKPMVVKRTERTVYRVRCADCYAQSPYRSNAFLHGYHETLGKAAEAWNRRKEDA